MSRHYYSQEDVAYIMENNGRISTKEIADRFGVQEHAIRKKIYTLRKSGTDIPHGRKVPVGTISKRFTKGRRLPRYCEKQQDGNWKDVTSQYREIIKPGHNKGVSKKTNNPVKRNSKKKAIVNKPKAISVSNKKCNNDKSFIKSWLGNRKIIINNDTTGKIPVKLDSRTTVYAKPGYDIEELKNKYLRETA